MSSSRRELIDQVRFTPHAEYAFRHPLIRTVAYESTAQIRSRPTAPAPGRRDRARDPASADENAALIAEHLEAAGDLHAAFGWHMRAGTWCDQPRHRRRAHELGAGPKDRRRPTRPTTPTGPSCASHRAPCCAATAWRVGGSGADTGFDELRELCTAAGDQRSLAIGMAGLVIDAHTYNAPARGVAAGHRTRRHARIDRRPALTVACRLRGGRGKHETAEMAERCGCRTGHRLVRR